MGSPGRPVGASFLVLVQVRLSGEASLREGVLAITVAEWTRDIALILSGIAGLLHWGWWFPVLFGAVAAVVREASQGFVLVQHWWFRLPHSIPNNELPALWCRCDSRLHGFGHLGAA
jgi:hypothetical protein